MMQDSGANPDRASHAGVSLLESVVTAVEEPRGVTALRSPLSCSDGPGPLAWPGASAPGFLPLESAVGSTIVKSEIGIPRQCGGGASLEPG